MKIILTITLSFVYLCGYGQIKDTCKHNIVCYFTEPPQYECDKCHKRFTSFYHHDGGIDTIDVNPIDTLNPVWRGEIKGLVIDTTQFIIFERHKNDTSPVIMLICDTSYTNMVGWYLDNKCEYWDYRWETKWWFGYSVIDWGIGERYYLDDKKKRLPASIIVWQTINRK